MIYLCTVCNEEVTKPALVSVTGWRTASISDFSIGLGKWHCRCGNNKVKAVKGQSEKHGKNSRKARVKKFKARPKTKGQAIAAARTRTYAAHPQGS